MATSKRASIADVVRDADNLLVSVGNHAERLGNLEQEKSVLEGLLAEHREHTARQLRATGEKLLASLESDNSLQEVREASFRLRAAIRGRLGPRNPLLGEFGMKPAPERKPRRNAATSPTPPTTPPTEPGEPSTPPPTPAV